MKRHTIEVDEQVHATLHREASRRLETPNTVIRRLLELDPPMNTLMSVASIPKRSEMIHDIRIMSELPRNVESKSSTFNLQPSTLSLPPLPHHIPATLEHTLQMIHLVKREGYTRIDATKALADWHRVAVPTITIKFTRLLGISAHEIDALLEPGREGDLVGLLVSNFPEYGEVIRETLDA
jgi:hypothetical protein